MATGALVQAAGTFANVSAERRAARLNEQYAQLQAADARRRGQEELRRHHMRASQLKGRQRASLAARGVDLTVGSPLEVLVSTEVMEALDARTIRENAEREAMGHEAAAQNFRMRAESANPFLSAAGSLLTSAGFVADRFYQYRQSGLRPFQRRPRQARGT